MTIQDLALSRAGFLTLREFQKANGLYPSGQLDTLTLQALEPFIYGFRRRTVRSGDTFWAISQEVGTPLSLLLAANPGLDPKRLSVGQVVTVPLPFPVVPTSLPFSSQVLEICITGLTARYPFLTRQTLTRTAFGRPLPVLTVGSGRRSILYNASHHANEWITTPVLMKFLEQLCEAYVLSKEIFGYDARQLLARCTLHLVPMVNPDGVDLVTGSISPDELEYLRARRLAESYPLIPFPDGWKANLNGVDLNLNYPAGWDNARRIKFSQGYTQPGPRDYVGRAPLDQAESAAMAAYTQAVKPALTFSYHSQGEVIYWKYLDLAPAGAEAVGRELARVSGYTLDLVPTASGYAGYKDWFILIYDRPGYTIEVGRGQNPLPLSQFDEIYRKNLGILTLGLVV